MKTLSLFILLLFPVFRGNPLLNQDIIYLNAEKENSGATRLFEMATEEEMQSAKEVLSKFWKKKITVESWENFNRQYMIHLSPEMGRVVMIQGSCLEKNKSFYEKTWILGMAKARCYFSCFVDIKKKKVCSFKFNTYDKELQEPQ